MSASCSNEQATIQQEMVALDRIYIPTLFYTSHKNTEKARKAITKLQIAWERFNADHYRDKADTLWRKDLDEVAGLISRADGLLNTGDNTESAHDALEEIRGIMGALRKRYGYEIFSDHLTNFHRPMEAIVLSVKGATAETLTDSTISVLQELTSEAQTLWTIVDSLELDSALYDMSSQERSELKGYIVEETERLNSLQKSLTPKANQSEQEYKQAILESSLTIKPPFVRAYTFFGAFDD